MASTFSNSNILTIEPNMALSSLSQTSTITNLGAAPRSLLQEVISTRSVLVTKRELDILQENIALVAFDQLAGVMEKQNKSFSPRLINWVEPVEISGIRKTSFYTEVNSGLKAGDRIFIIGGNYCNNELIQIDKYKGGRDGYKVLEVDNCRIVLDIDYTGILPYNKEEDDQFIKVYYIRDRNEFIQANRQISTRDGFNYKFGKFQNNIAFIDQQYPSISGWGKSAGAFSTPGFLIKNDDPNGAWLSIPFTSGSFSFALSPNFPNNNRVKIMNSSFTYNNKEYKEGYVYKFIEGPTQSDWVVDVAYIQPIITKSNFRNGNFKGNWNSGLYGKPNQKIKWHGDGNWNSGTLWNTKWNNGTINSNFTLPQSYFTTFDEFGLPFQKENLPDNNGRSFNYIFDSEIDRSTINRGNIYNTILGTLSTSKSAVEDYILSATESFPINVNKAFIDSSEFNNTHVELSEINNSRHHNSKVVTSRIVNSYFNESVVKDSSYTSDTVISILGYDEFNMAETLGTGTYSSISGANQKVYKFYINEENYKRLKNKDGFYIKGLSFRNDVKDVINFFDKKFKLTSWKEYIDYLSTPETTPSLPTDVSQYQFYKRGIEHSAFLVTKEENKFRYTTVTDGSNYFSSTVDINPNKNYSIDIVTSVYDLLGNTFSEINFNRDISTSSSTSPTMSNMINQGRTKGGLIDVSKAYIIDSDFESGLFENSDWNSGPHIQYNYDNNITVRNSSGGVYDLVLSTSSSTIFATISYNSSSLESEGLINNGKVAFLRSVDYVIDGVVTGITISFAGTSYSSTSSVGLTGSVYGQDLSINITSTSGQVSNVEISTHGYNYQVGEVLTIQSGDQNATITILSIEQSVTRIPDSYKITSTGDNSISLIELYSGTNSVLSNLGRGGVFKTLDAQNRWGYIHFSKINKSKIKSGFFRRPYITNSLIEIDNYNSKDIDYSNLETIRSLVISDGIFSNNGNIQSKATYINSHFVGGSDTFNDGIVQNSVWNKGVFNVGTIKESRWVDGKFRSGLFYDSRSFDGLSKINSPFYYSENLKNYWKDGVTTSTQSNDRWSWQKGKFGSEFKSEFYKSDWENGEFTNGKFYFSKFYNGTFSIGTIGDDRLLTSETFIYNGDFTGAVVDNSTFISKDTSFYQNQPQKITWKLGRFNSGVFATDWEQMSTNQSIWENGDFNGGEFKSMAKWRNGNFNGGKFTTAFGWTNSNSASQSQYGWENGIFNSGEFGTADGLTNSTWFTGEFNDGIFKGRVWNLGIFKKGIFEGGSKTSAIGGTYSSNAATFVDGYTNSYYGLWRDGYFTEVKDRFIKDEKIFTEPTRNTQEEYVEKSNRAIIRNSLWENGTFSHQSGEMVNSVWLNGGFQAGKMTNSSFNPYVKRSGSSTQSFNLSESCYWENGTFNGGDFYISKWNGGMFEVGNAYGMIWKNGTANYMNAFNVFWEDGLWRNGNWYGSYFEFNGSITEDFEKQILFRGMSWSGTASAHYWNIFEIVDPKSKFFFQAGTATPAIDTTIDSQNLNIDLAPPPEGGGGE